MDLQIHYLLSRVEKMNQNVFTSADFLDPVVFKIYQTSALQITTKAIEFDVKRDA